jgi:hypothetical protein
MHDRREEGVQGFGERKRALRRPRHRWEDEIRMDREIGWVWSGFRWLRIGTNGGFL